MSSQHFSLETDPSEKIEVEERRAVELKVFNPTQEDVAVKIKCSSNEVLAVSSLFLLSSFFIFLYCSNCYMCFSF